MDVSYLIKELSFGSLCLLPRHLLLGHGDGHHHRDALLPLHLREVRMGPSKEMRATNNKCGVTLVLSVAFTTKTKSYKRAHKLLNN